MSRIYEAFKRNEGSQPVAVAEVIDGIPGLCETYESVAVERPTSMPSALADEASPPCQFDYRQVTANVAKSAPIFLAEASDDLVAEQYRLLRTNILHHPAQPKVIALSSATPGDGKTVTAINFASTMALRSGSRVLLIDADLRRSTVAAVLGIEPLPGLSEVLRGEKTMQEAVVRLEQLPTFHVLPAGVGSSNPVELLDSTLWRDLVKSLRDEFEMVIMDTTPMGTVADFKLVQEVCDGVMMVVRPDHTNRSAFMKAIESDGQQKLLGTVINAYENSLFWKRPDSAYHYRAVSPGPSRSFWRR